MSSQSIEIFDNIEQGTDEWKRIRLGIPTASNFDSVQANGRGGAESKTRRTYMLKLIGERLTGEPKDDYTNAHMERGQIMEAEARNAYSFLTNSATVQVGFIRNGQKGASPDSLIGDNGMLEIKTKLPHLHLDVLLRGVLPPEHVPQVQGQLLVAEREWCDFMSYWPKLPPFIIRVHRDEQYIKELSQSVDRFLSEMEELIQKITA